MTSHITPFIGSITVVVILMASLIVYPYEYNTNVDSGPSHGTVPCIKIYAKIVKDQANSKIDPNKVNAEITNYISKCS